MSHSCVYCSGLVSLFVSLFCWLVGWSLARSKTFFLLSLLFMYIGSAHLVPALPSAASKGHGVREVVSFLCGCWKPNLGPLEE